MPAFTSGVGDIQSAGEHGTPAGTLPSDGPFALDLCRSLIDAGIDIAFSDRIAIDHGISHAFLWVIGEDTPIRSEEHTSELQSLMRISYAVVGLKKKKSQPYQSTPNHL